MFLIKFHCALLLRYDPRSMERSFVTKKTSYGAHLLQAKSLISSSGCSSQQLLYMYSSSIFKYKLLFLSYRTPQKVITLRLSLQQQLIIAFCLPLQDQNQKPSCSSCLSPRLVNLHSCHSLSLSMGLGDPVISAVSRPF